MMGTPVYYWIIATYDDEKQEWVKGTVKYPTEFTARLTAEKLNLPLEKIDLIKCHFEF